MRDRVLAEDGRVYMAVAILSLLVSFIFGRASGLTGMAIGLASATFGATALWLVIQVLGRAMSEGADPGRATVLAVMGVMLKIPLYLFAWKAASFVGRAAPACFLAGVVLVYFGLVMWAISRNRRSSV